MSFSPERSTSKNLPRPPPSRQFQSPSRCRMPCQKCQFGLILLATPCIPLILVCRQRQQNENMIGGAGTRGCKAADYLCKASVCKGQNWGGGGLKPPVKPPLYVEVVNLSFSTLLFSLNPLTNNLFYFPLHDCVH